MLKKILILILLGAFLVACSSPGDNATLKTNNTTSQADAGTGGGDGDGDGDGH